VATTTFLDNPFFIHYGKTVDQCFDLDMGVGAPISIFPAQIKGVDYAADSEHEHNNLAGYADKSQLSLFESKVNRLRETLLGEAHNIAGQAPTPTTQKLKAFRQGLAQGSEAMLEENPFFELTALLYQINMTAMRQAFVAEQKGVDVDMPQAIKSSRSIGHIWGRGGALIPIKQKITETLSKVTSVGKVGFGLLLFVGSSLTTAKGVTDVIQLPSVTDVIGTGLVGGEHEDVRFALALFIGLVLSSVILDFKSRLFQGIAEQGKVFAGYWNAFKIYPRWVFISCFLTMISIWTNYDGIVLLMSKTQDLSYQWEKIEHQVGSAMGDPQKIDPDNPQSLLGLKAALEKKSALAIKKFEQVPVDEMSGSASSGVASKGPRYWAKYFIVHGGFKLGSNDISSSYRRTAFVGRIDRILHRADLDLSTSLEDKIATILKRYGIHLDKTQTEVNVYMNTLGSQMVLDSYSLEKLTRLFNLEAYHINNSVQEVVKLLVLNKDEFAAAAQEINKLAADYIELLRTVDKIGTPANNKYTIDVNIEIPTVEAIDQLKNGEIPKAERRGLAELKDLLLERHGAFIGGAILFTILFIAIFMDMSDPILYSAMVARWGRRDEHFLNENMDRFVAWEEKYVANLRSFFVKPEVQPLLPKLTCPRNLVFRNGYNYFLEEMDPRVKDTSNRNWLQLFRFWFQDLFINTRMQHVGEYNSRQIAVRKLIREREKYAPRLVDKIFPGLKPDFTPGGDNFDLLYNTVSKKLNQNEHAFFEVLNTFIPGASPNDTLVHKEGLDENAMTYVQKPAGFMDSKAGHFLLAIKKWTHNILNRSLVEPVSSSPLTRISWIKSVAKAQIQSSSDINHLSQFTPDLENWLVKKRFPIIQQEILDPLESILSQIPNQQALDDALEITAIRDKYQNIKGVLTEVLGLSIFRGFRLKKDTLVNIIESSGIDEAKAVFLSREMEAAALEAVIDKIENRLNRTYSLVKTLVEEQNPIVFTLTKMRRDYLSPINTILSRLHYRELIEESLGLNKLTAEIISCEDFMLQLWNEAPITHDAPNDKSYDIKQTDANPIINFFFCNKENVEFTLLDEIKQLENTMRETHNRLNSIIFTLTFIDKLSVKILSQVDQSADIVNRILQADQQLHIHQQEGLESDQKKINFLDDNRLFFRSTPMQIKTVQTKINKLLRDPSLAEQYNVELFRKLDNQMFKLHNFLKNSLDYVEGKRDGTGLSAALAQISPQFAGGIESEAQQASDDSRQAKLSSIPSLSKARKLCSQIKELLEKISLQEWDMLKLPIPPQKGMAVMKTNKQFVDQAWLDVEDIFYALEKLDQYKAEHTTGDDKAELTTQQGRAETLLKKLESIHTQISQPFFADRRLEAEATMSPSEKETKRRFRENNQELCTASEPNTRRTNERVRITSSIEMTTIIDGQIINGEIVDVSVNGLCIKTNKPSTGLKTDAQATFRFVAQKDDAEFTCRVVRASGTTIILTISSDQEATFSKLIRSYIVD
jgi:hypothetical protein